MLTPFTGGGGIFSNKINYQNIYNAILQNLSPVFAENASPKFFEGKIETFLTCRKLAEHLRGNIFNNTAGKFFEEMSLSAVYRTNNSIADLELLFSELPYILPLNYPVVNEIRKVCMNILPQLSNVWRQNDLWREFAEYDYLLNMLKAFNVYQK